MGVKGPCRTGYLTWDLYLQSMRWEEIGQCSASEEINIFQIIQWSPMLAETLQRSFSFFSSSFGQSGSIVMGMIGRSENECNPYIESQDEGRLPFTKLFKISSH